MRKTFVKDIRELRKCEIRQYEAKGYRVPDKAKYILNDVIQIKIGPTEYRFGIRVNINEVYFYILQGGGQIYLTIYQIYLLLWELVHIKGKKHLMDALVFYEKNDEEITFIYKDQKYTVHGLPDLPENDEIMLPDSDVGISETELILLIYLIQDKSNYLEGLGGKKTYRNGLVRMLKVLLQCNAPNNVLETLGWVFRPELGRFDLRKEKLVGARNKKRYYLTAAEERLIL